MVSDFEEEFGRFQVTRVYLRAIAIVSAALGLVDLVYRDLFVQLQLGHVENPEHDEARDY